MAFGQQQNQPSSPGIFRPAGSARCSPHKFHPLRVRQCEGACHAPIVVYNWLLQSTSATVEAFVFQQKRAPGRPLWDSGVRDALHQAAAAEGCDFPGLGPHSFLRANITWRQQVGGSAIEASKIAGHSDLEITGEYTFITAERQNELTRLIQEKLVQAAPKAGEESGELTKAAPDTPELASLVAAAKPATQILQ